MNDSESYQRANAAALRFLSYRPRSEAEVRNRLRRRFPADVVQQVMESLADQALLDDSKFAGLWAGQRDALSPRSAFAIVRELTAKGVSRETAQAAVTDVDDEDSAYRAGTKVARRMDAADFPTFRRKVWGYLLRRGFSRSVARQTVSRLWEERPAANPPQPDEGQRP